MRYKYRMTFEKINGLQYLGHLDLLKMFQRAANRSRLPIAYSQGFSPHQLTSFALPVPLGMEAFAEVVDIELSEPRSDAEIIEGMNSALPSGMRVTAVAAILEGEKASAALVSGAVYEAEIPAGDDTIREINRVIAEILRSPTLPVMKKTKSAVKETDVRPDILELLPAKPQNGRVLLRMRLSAGSSRFLRPDIVVLYILERAGVPANPLAVKYRRKELIMNWETKS